MDIYRRQKLALQVRYYGGQLKCEYFTINHPVEFYGCGTFILKNAVTLGYQLAGSKGLPILFQPRVADSIIEIGSGTYIVNGTEIIALKNITIGDNCLIGSRCTIMDSDFHGIHPSQRMGQGLTKPINIGDNVWLGSGVTVLKGVTIGNNSVIAAKSVVTKSIPNDVIAAGNPAQVVASVYGN